MNKAIEVSKGKHIVDACIAEGVTHLVFSSLPHVERLTNGQLTQVHHFDGKAEVSEYAEKIKGDMIVSHFMPAMYFKSYKDQIRVINGSPRLVMPFALKDDQTTTWPVLDARADSGKYNMGLFEGAKSADEVHVAAVSTWVSPKELLKAVSGAAGVEVTFEAVSKEDLAAMLPSNIAGEITETMLLVRDFQYYGIGSYKLQQQQDEWLLSGSKGTSLQQIVDNAGPWPFQKDASVIF